MINFGMASCLITFNGKYSEYQGKDDNNDKLANVSNKAKTARTEFISQLRDVCVHILHSQDGARLTMNALWHGSAKDRKGKHLLFFEESRQKIQKNVLIQRSKQVCFNF